VRLQRAAATHGGGDPVEQIDHRHGLRAADVVGVLHAGVERERADEALRHVRDGHRLQTLAAGADHRHDRQAPDHAREDRDEAVTAAVDDRRAEDRPGDGTRADRLLGRPLGLVIA